MEWKKTTDIPNDKGDYLVRWRMPDGDYSQAHRAYYLSEYGQFFSAECTGTVALAVDVYTEITEPE